MMLARVRYLPLVLVLVLGAVACTAQSGGGADATSRDQGIPTTCGNGQVEVGEDCDDGNTDETDSCLSNCKLAFCGDGHVRAKIEECDDGNEGDNDGCSTLCKAKAVQVNTSVYGDQEAPAVAVGPDGTVWVVWTDGSKIAPDANDLTIRMRRFSAGGSPLDPNDVSVPTTFTGNQQDPDIAINSEGNVLIVWTDWSQSGSDTEGTAVRGRLFLSTGQPSGDDFIINSTTQEAQAAPAVCATADNGFAVVFTDTSPANEQGADIRLRMIGSDGTPSGDDQRVNTADQGDQLAPDIAAGPGGALFIVWQSQSSEDKDPDKGIEGRIYSAQGAAVSAELGLNAVTEGRQQRPTVAGTASGFVVAWDDDSAQGSDAEGLAVRLRWFSADGTPTAEEVVANTTTAGGQGSPALASAGEQTVLVWEDASEAAMNKDIRGRWYGSGTASDAADVLITTTREGEQSLPAVAFTPEGAAVVVWQASAALGTTTLDSDGYGIQLRRLSH